MLITGRLSQLHTRPAAARKLGVHLRYKLLLATVFLAHGQYTEYVSIIIIIITISS